MIVPEFKKRNLLPMTPTLQNGLVHQYRYPVIMSMSMPLVMMTKEMLPDQHTFLLETIHPGHKQLNYLPSVMANRAAAG